MRLSSLLSLVGLCGCNAAFGIGDLTFEEATGVGSTSATGGAGGGESTGGTGGEGGTGGLGGAGGTDPTGLSDDGLLARYFFDDARRGMAPTTALDASPNDVHLSIVFDNGELLWDTLNDNAGLRWPNPGADGSAQVIDVSDTPLGEGLAGSPTATVEVVARIDAVTGTSSRLFDIGHAAQTQLSLGSDILGSFEVRLADTAMGTFSSTDAIGTRQVYHLVIDLDAMGRKAVALYADGAPHPTMSRHAVMTMGIPIDSLDAFVVGNRLDGNRSIEGFIGYVALYDVPFDDARIADHTARLLASDDP
ncbi:MAG: LamG-like jellyroll fold domain-containing protein [Polyangiaceae bacterium]